MYYKVLKIGAFMGCHQRPDRSFFYHGKQFPVCARCTGVVIGNLLAMVLFPVVDINFLVCCLFCLILLLDWLIQYLQIKESTNLRRLVTGILCGYGLLTIELHIALWIAAQIVKCF